MNTPHTLIVLLFAATLLTTTSAQAQEAPLDMSGRWVMVQQTVTSSDIPVLGKIRATTRAVVLYDLQQDGARVQGEGQLCALNIDSGTRMVDTVLPAAFRQAQPTPKLDAVLKQRGDAWRLEQRRMWTVLGAKLKNPTRDALPLRSEDPRVWDQDKDGKPGVTVRIKGFVGGDIYVAQRSWSDLVAIIKDNNRLRGSIRFDQEQVILGATNDLLTDPPEATPDLRRSFFAMERMPAQTTCAQALEKTRSLR